MQGNQYSQDQHQRAGYHPPALIIRTMRAEYGPALPASATPISRTATACRLQGHANRLRETALKGLPNTLALKRLSKLFD